MIQEATHIELREELREELESWVRSGTAEQRMVMRAKIILLASGGMATNAIGRQMGITPATVSKWRTRFAADGIAGLQDAPRPGTAKVYGEDTEKRILSTLDETPPDGYATWDGKLIAQALGDVSKHQVWRILRNHGIQLARRRSWCISTDPEFSVKAADIVGIYLDPPENAVVIAVDEKPGIQALERAQGYLKLPNGRAITGYSHEYKRHGTTTLYAALDVATGIVKAGHTNRRRRKDFLGFMNKVIGQYPDQEIHMILDNLKTHKPKHDRWLSRHKNVHFHFTPTHASWLNQVECWFSILWRKALRGASFTSPAQVRKAIDSFIVVYNQNAAPFEWKKDKVYSVHPQKRYSELCN